MAAGWLAPSGTQGPLHQPACASPHMQASSTHPTNTQASRAGLGLAGAHARLAVVWVGDSRLHAPATGTKRGKRGSGQTCLPSPEASLLYGEGTGLGEDPKGHQTPNLRQCQADFSRGYSNSNTAGIRAMPPQWSPYQPPHPALPFKLVGVGLTTHTSYVAPWQVVKRLDCNKPRSGSRPAPLGCNTPVSSPQCGDDARASRGVSVG